MEDSEHPEDTDERRQIILDDNATGILDPYTGDSDTAPLQDAESSLIVTGLMEIDLNMNASLFLEPLPCEISDNHSQEIYHSSLRQSDSLKYYEHICSRAAGLILGRQPH